MNVSVIDLKGIQFEGEAVSVNAKTMSGEITILDHHLPLITALSAGTAKIGLKNGEVKAIQADSGFLEIDDKNNLSILID